MKKLLLAFLLFFACLPAQATLTTATGFAPGLVGTLGYQVLTISGTTVTVATARTTTGITAGVQPGLYVANPTLPPNCAVLFDDAAGHYAVQEFGTLRCVAGFAIGLSRVGYTPLASTGTAGTRTTSGVVELSVGTGIYGVASITGAGATWDDGQSRPTYATEMFGVGGPPLSITSTLNGSNQKVLTWAADPLATSYNIYRRVTGTTADLMIGTVAAPTVTFTDASAVPSINYTYHLGVVH